MLRQRSMNALARTMAAFAIARTIVSLSAER